ncbi:hypothetical protein CRYUN_Cryun26dG0038700 [Craigia yunnanensis]
MFRWTVRLRTKHGLIEAANHTAIRQEVEYAMRKQRNSTEFSRGQPDRRLLQEENPKPDLTVAQDGTGDFRTISESVVLIPKKNKSRTIFIHIPIASFTVTAMSLEPLISSLEMRLWFCKIAALNQGSPGLTSSTRSRPKARLTQIRTRVFDPMVLISPFDNLTATTYLGRPSKDFASAIFMHSYIGEFVEPAGWTQWTQGIDPPNSLCYAEYENMGPGSGVSTNKLARYKPNTTNQEAARYTVVSFIQRSQWLPKANIMYESKFRMRKMKIMSERRASSIDGMHIFKKYHLFF